MSKECVKDTHDMTTQHTTPPAQAEIAAKTRHNIVLEPDTRERGEKLMVLEKRSFNNLVEVLIDREYARQLAAEKIPHPEEQPA